MSCDLPYGLAEQEQTHMHRLTGACDEHLLIFSLLNSCFHRKLILFVTVIAF